MATIEELKEFFYLKSELLNLDESKALVAAALTSGLNVAETSTNPGTPAQVQIYLAVEVGNYTHFPAAGATTISLAQNEIAILIFDPGTGEWTKQTQTISVDLTAYTKKEYNVSIISDVIAGVITPKIQAYRDGVSYPLGTKNAINFKVYAMLVQVADGPIYVLRVDSDYADYYNIGPDTTGTYANYSIYLDLDVLYAATNTVDGGYRYVDINTADLFVKKDTGTAKKINELQLVQYYYGKLINAPFFGLKIQDFLLTENNAAQNNLMDARNYYGTQAAATLSQTTGSAILVDTGAVVASINWKYCDYIPVIPGSTILFTGVISGSRALAGAQMFGIAGYDANKTYLSGSDMYGLPAGEVLSKDRIAALSNTARDTSRLLLTDYAVEIPYGCYFIRCSTGYQHAVTGDPISEMTVKLPAFDPTAESVKARLAKMALTIPADVRKYNVELVTSTINGVITPKIIVYKDTQSYPGSSKNAINFKVYAMIVQPKDDYVYLLRADSGYAGYYNIGPDPAKVMSNHGVYIDLDVMYANAAAPDSGGIRVVDINTANLFILKAYTTKKKINELLLAKYYYGVLETAPYFEDLVQAFYRSYNVSIISSAINGVATSKVIAYRDSQTYPSNTKNAINFKVYGMLVQPQDGLIYVLRADTGYAGYFNIGPDPAKTLANHSVFLDLDVMYRVGVPDGNGYSFVDINTSGLFVLKSQGVPKKINELQLAKYYYGYLETAPYFEDILQAFYRTESALDYKAVMENSVKELVKSNRIGKNPATHDFYNRFTFGHISDIHPDSLNAIKNTQSAIDFFNKDAALASQCKVIACTGDICNGDKARNKATTLAELREVVTLLTGVTQAIPAFTLIGNHDTNVNESDSSNPANSYTNALSKTEQYTEMIAPFKTKNGSIMSVTTNKAYFYVDFATDKIRMICLDQFDYVAAPDDVDATKLKYTYGFVYSQAQLDWLYSTLNGTPSDYGVIVLTHGPNLPGYEAGSFRQGTDYMPSIIQAYKNGTAFSRDWNGDTWPDMATSKNFDFTTRGPSEVIMWLCGHTHTREFINYKDVNVFVVPCLWTEPVTAATNNTVVPLGIRTLRDDNTATESSFNIYSIDRVEKKIYTTFYGAYLDLNKTYTIRNKIISY